MAKKQKIRRRKWNAIYDRFKNHPYIICAEVGVHQGENSKNILKLLKKIEKFCLIDMWSPNTYDGKGHESAKDKYIKLYQDECEQNYNKTLLNISPYKNKVEIIKGDSALSAENFSDGYFDFVFIDADHSYEGCLADIKAWFPKVKKGGYICGHDYPRYDGVVRAVNEIFGSDIELDSDYTWFYRV